jgi:hypothetical protein
VLAGGCPAGARFIGYGGAGQLPGTSTKLVYLPGSDTVFTLLVNMSAPPGEPQLLARLLSLFGPRP